MTTENASVNVTVTPISELYKYAARANGSQIMCLDLDRLTEADIALEEEHYEKTKALRVAQGKSPYGSLRGTSAGGLVRGEGFAVTMFGENLERQSAREGGIANLLRNWGGGRRVGHPTAAVNGSVRTATVARATEVDPEARLKQIREEEARLMAIVEERKAKAESALNALVEQVQEFFDIDSDTLKEVLKSASATDLASGMRAAKAFLA